MKRSEVLTQAISWMDLEHMIVIERTRHRRTHFTCPFIRDVQYRKIYKDRSIWWCLGLGERHHELLCKRYRKIAAKDPSVDGGGLKTQKPPSCGVPTAFPMGKHPEGLREWVHGSWSVPHPQQKGPVGTPLPRGVGWPA